MLILEKRGTPTNLTNFSNYSCLLKIGLILPKFNKPNLQRKFKYGIDELIDNMLNIDPIMRPSCTEALF